ncbi:CD59 glycoprotein [Fukomys damarensis]|uniref:MAC-inhibitory protein n=1 Tax=Fukomys damarensis TaxID=885580 RepID=A0A091CRE2_FUKDA|nr:CD59 glycoprotein [Fukomys damarensis]XP_010610929.1 CD59 glycoprotein [Fukomys damarensis]XP_010610931.1 CD59 glycoprotein [Fukomys damarensis]XP_010610932.1 CD59 glycoprotein [Fukomys damarensis]XP_010610933.1 CD59 glycoprotein [Fukomys damarensis]XP_010610934.1 CD59 glycoprotein [Fukomys damarensis]XP_010610935.1 CD59 glycoprotein [Fukomys damarensis]XP_019061327.1 CD59 glycoprotein [Fukomys damarensis]XP_019061328.1 CD59 glycoprotein [Fukomys damarensis]KFO19935.1 CD59 glycoprotein 
MRSQGGVTLLRLLLILAALCCTGFSLKCYECLKKTATCSETKLCTPNLDACLIAQSGDRVYRQCWRDADCHLRFLKERLDENKVLYRCCQKNLCNAELDDTEEDGAAALSGKTVLLVTPFLTSVWNLCF